MAISYGKTIIGKMVMKRRNKRYTLQIRRGNCLAVIIYVRKMTEEEMREKPGAKYLHTLYDFYLDEKQIKRMYEKDGDVLGDGIASIELNMFYKESQTLLKYFVKSGHKVKCYYKEEETRNEEEES